MISQIHEEKWHYTTMFVFFFNVKLVYAIQSNEMGEKLTGKTFIDG